ncbi:MAG: hypothetical protein PHX74_09000 [Candidatus Sumerlaeales bacterium]|nr:hypothetical protein [Candidatus Sumerlaeales bacterium]
MKKLIAIAVLVAFSGAMISGCCPKAQPSYVPCAPVKAACYK